MCTPVHLFFMITVFGDWMQRNLRTMISSGLSANQEKHAQFQQIKRESIELITQVGIFLGNSNRGSVYGHENAYVLLEF